VKPIRKAAALAASIMLAACAMAVSNKEDMLAAAGFKIQPANTPQRQAALRSMPPHKFSSQVRSNRVVWVYADPTVCNCLYLGDQQAYDTYRRLVFDRNQLQEEQRVAWMNQNNAVPYPFAWEAWGPETPFY
jgi:hypothetical protein